jgi:thiol-disulfide isomerase/thioredoxin
MEQKSQMKHFRNLAAILLLSALFLPFSLEAKSNLLRAGQWRGVLQMNDTTELPFTFEIKHGDGGSFLTVINAQERILVDAFRLDTDSVWWTMPVFNTKFRCRRESDTTFSGEFHNTAAGKPYVLPFRAVHMKPRFPAVTCGRRCDFSGKWECTFSPGKKDSSKAIGLFQIDALQKYTGTFATEYGDYRFLEGAYTGCCEMSLSCFDGQFAYLFKAKLSGDTIIGQYWAGKYYYQSWTAKRNDKFELRDPDKLSWAKDSTDVDFTFNDLNGKPVSLSDYRGKVVIIQIMGTWCPNCLDETAWMQEVYTKYHAQGLEVIGLAYERKGDTATQNAAIRRIRDRFGVTYTLLNTGKSGKDSASASLPFLSGIFCFPTSIYIDKSGNVRRIHSGYNGPATGAYYTRDTEEALRFIQQLLAEKPGKQ